MKRWAWIAAVVAVVLGLAVPMARVWGQQKTVGELRTLFGQGNYKEAYDGLAPKVVAAGGTDKLEDDFRTCIQALNNLARTDEADDFREKAIAAHAKEWRFLQATAESYRDEQHYGTVISGVFHRGNNRNGDGKWVSSADRDRVRALQLMQQATGLVKGEKNPATGDVAVFYYQLASMLLQGDYGVDAWRLQTLTDLSKLPDYADQGNTGPYYYRGYQAPRGAPVDEAGNPVFYQIPKGGWEGAKTDGERWRWALLQASELSPVEAAHARANFASFLLSQFGVQTMAEYGQLLRGGPEEGKKDESGPFAVYTLKDDETIAKLANGIKRFKLPDEFNPIKQLELGAADGVDKEMQANAMASLAGIYADRQQYETAADWWKKAIAQFGPGLNNFRQLALDQIVGNWGSFDNVLEQPAGDVGAKVDFRFRNGSKVAFTAREIDVRKLLGDIKDYLKRDPAQIDWQQITADNIGYRLVTNNEEKYIGKQVAAWEMDLTPRANHFDKRITVQTPLKKAGAYLLVGKVAGGNTTRVVVWVSDMVLVRKPLVDKTYTFVADAVTGRAMADVNVEFFGYRQVNVRDRQFRVDTQDYVGKTDAQGQVVVDNAETANDNNPLPAIDPKHPVLKNGLNWLEIATTGEGRLAFTGMQGIWSPQWGGRIYDGYDSQYNQVKAFIMTDRPVYRPDQKVQFKMWLGENKYDQDGKNPWGGKHVWADIRNPRGDVVKVFEGDLDAWGGMNGELALDHNAPLGTYTVMHWTGGSNSGPSYGSTSFRVEEYKKPEFEVTVDAPGEPVMLGEKVKATIHAKYYFGSPVVNAQVHYKVTRTTYEARWYPAGRWDWFYEPGYWWFAADYLWYPGFSRWGVMRPIHAWRPGMWSNEQPEVISDGEVPVGPDGSVKVEIDTAVAKAAYGDRDHKYTISAEVTDASRRTISGSGDVLVARDPFKVYAWVDRGYYGVGDTVRAYFNAQTLANKPVMGKGALKLYRISYDANAKATETEVQHWDLDTKADGTSEVQIHAEKAGQYRLGYTVTDAQGHAMEGGYIFVVRGAGFDGKDFHFNDVEMTTDKKEYQAGDKVRLMLNVEMENATVLLFARPSNGFYLPPKVIEMKGKSTVEEVEVSKKDMPNFFVEALTISGARVRTEVREVIVPPEERVLDVAVSADAKEYKPGQKGTLTVKVTEKNGEPFTGAAVVSLYDKAVEYISGGTNVSDIRGYFWKWRRTHNVNQVTSAEKSSGEALKNGEVGMGYLGAFGVMASEYGMEDKLGQDRDGLFQNHAMGRRETGSAIGGGGGRGGGGGGLFLAAQGSLAGEEKSLSMSRAMPVAAASAPMGGVGLPSAGPDVEPSVRSNFADTALWAPQLVTAANGVATVDVTMPENLTTWKAKAWLFGNGSRVGEGETEVVTRKNLIVRLEAPRFFVQTDEVVLSTIVHNYLATAKRVRVDLKVPSAQFSLISTDASISNDSKIQWVTQIAEIKPQGEARLDWRVKVRDEGQATITALAITDEESDATQMTFPVYVHGMLKTESFAGALRPDPLDSGGVISSLVKLTVPKERRVEQTMLEVRYSPSLACAMVDALPYMVDYPYGCTEQTLNRFVPTVVTQKILKEMKLDLATIQKTRTNLNAQEIGDAKERAAQWGFLPQNSQFSVHEFKNPVFDEREVADMVREGVAKLGNMQLSDGGWGWFSGYGEQSYPHTTALVVHGLQEARDNGAAVDAAVIERGVEWLMKDQAKRLAYIKEKRSERKAENMDAFEYMVLVDAGHDNREMREIIYTDRNELAVYTKAMFGLAMTAVKDPEKLEMMLRNCKQFLTQDDENQTAYFKLPGANYWWNWYGSENEAHAYYLKLLAKTDPKGRDASRLAKYILNNRKNATYWNSTRDTAICVEALADYIRATGEDRPDMTVTLKLDGKAVQSRKITAENLFTFDNRFAIGGAELADGGHTLEISREGTGPLYYNAYLSNFTMEEHITKAGLEIKVNRKIYHLTRDDATAKAEGEHGQAVDKRVEKYVRTEVSDGQMLKSGDLVEVELTVDSKNDYEYILLEDMKAAGFEPVEVRSGYNGNDMGAYVEFHDERVAFFVRSLGRGTHSVSYRLRAEVPGAFSALPTKASAMYAPELKANSDEIKVKIVD